MSKLSQADAQMFRLQIKAKLKFSVKGIKTADTLFKAHVAKKETNPLALFLGGVFKGQSSLVAETKTFDLNP